MICEAQKLKGWTFWRLYYFIWSWFRYTDLLSNKLKSNSHNSQQTSVSQKSTLTHTHILLTLLGINGVKVTPCGPAVFDRRHAIVWTKASFSNVSHKLLCWNYKGGFSSRYTQQLLFSCLRALAHISHVHICYWFTELSTLFEKTNGCWMQQKPKVKRSRRLTPITGQKRGETQPGLKQLVQGWVWTRWGWSNTSFTGSG